MSATPPTLAILAALPRWVAWRTEPRKPGERITKVPYAPDGQRAESDNPGTWGTRARAEAAFSRLDATPHGPGGVGLMLGEWPDGFAIGGVDLDACRDPATGTLDPWARDVLALLETYAEVSPSGTGVKAFFLMPHGAVEALRGESLIERNPPGFGRSFKRGNGSDHPPAIEVHLGRRYYAVTGERLSEAPEALAQVEPDALRRLLGVIGPAFAGKGRERRAESPDRSAKAFRMAASIKAAGGNYAAFVAALDADAELAAWKREKGEATDGREMRRAWDRAGAKDEALVTEDAAALEFAARHRNTLRFCHTAGAWHRWDGAIWRKEETRLAYRWAREVARDLAQESGEAKAVVAAGKAAFAAGVERFCQADEAFAVTAALWDRDPWLLGTPGGTVDLHTGALRPARQDDHITRATAVTPAQREDCPTWLAFLDQATGRDEHLIGFLRRWFGYCLTGETREHALLFVYGPGGNGKGVLLNTVAGILGSYAANAAMDTFTASPGERHPTDLAMLHGPRMVMATETEEGRAWAEARIKAMTGGDPITARFMRRDFFTFQPAFKLTISGNHKPALRNVDEAARRRFNVVPFTHKPERPDQTLPERLRREWSGILRWMIGGCLEWQQFGLMRPKVVNEATAEYFSEQDVLRQWVEECCDASERPPHFADTNASLFGSWRNYALSRGEEPRSAKWFKTAMERAGFASIKDTAGIRGRGFTGLRVKVQRAHYEGGDE